MIFKFFLQKHSDANIKIPKVDLADIYSSILFLSTVALICHHTSTIWDGPSNSLFASVRIQFACDEPAAEGGDCEEARGDHEAGRACRDLHAAEQSALCCPVQPGCSHLSGYTWM